MRSAGTHDLPAGPERVWTALADPNVLRTTVPAVRTVVPGPPLRATVDWHLAAVDGAFDVTVEVADAEPPRRASLHVLVRGEPGLLRSTVVAELAEHAGGTRLAWEADCAVEGAIATVGSSVVEAAVRREADALFDRLARHLAGPEPAPGRPQETPRPPAWGPFEDGRAQAADPLRLVLAGLAGALAAFAAVWLARRLTRSR